MDFSFSFLLLSVEAVFESLLGSPKSVILSLGRIFSSAVGMKNLSALCTEATLTLSGRFNSINDLPHALL